jgi:hypothetical protein
LAFKGDITMTQATVLRTAFWVILVAFLVWDFLSSKPVDLRFEAPFIAAGSGQAVQGGHCSMPD